MFSYTELPDGIFRMLLGLWKTFSAAYSKVIDECNIVIWDDVTLFSVLLGSGVAVFLSISLVKWLKEVVF